MNFYLEPEGDVLQQGDILFPVPFLGFSFALDNVVDGDGFRPLKADVAESGESRIMFDSTWGMVVTQSCDLATHAKARDLITLARIYPVSERMPDENLCVPKKLDAFISRLKNAGKTPQYFYLPPLEESSFPASVTYLLELQAFARSDYQSLRQRVLFRLSSGALAAFQERLAYCFGRYAAEDDMYYTPSELLVKP